MVATDMRCAIIGAGSYGQVYYSYLKKAGINIVAFIDDNPDLLGKYVLGVPVIGNTDLLSVLKDKYSIEAVYCPIGNNKVRVKLLEKAKLNGLNTPCYIDETVIIANDTIIGEGVYILGGTHVMPFVKIDDFVMISVSSNIIHHSILGKGTFISNAVNFGAFVESEECAFVGMGATVMTGVKRIGKNSIVGAGSVVIKDVPDNSVVAGVPARVIKEF